MPYKSIIKSTVQLFSEASANSRLKQCRPQLLVAAANEYISSRADVYYHIVSGIISPAPRRTFIAFRRRWSPFNRGLVANTATYTHTHAHNTGLIRLCVLISLNHSVVSLLPPIVAKHTLRDYLPEDYRPWAGRPQGRGPGGGGGHTHRFLVSRPNPKSIDRNSPVTSQRAISGVWEKLKIFCKMESVVQVI